MKIRFVLPVLILTATFLGGAAETWTVQTSGTKANLTSISCTDANTCYAVGDSGVILKTTNGGTAWVKLASGVTGNLSSIQFVNANTGYAVGAGGKILRTINGGMAWGAQFSATSKDLSSISCPSATACLAAAYGGVVVNVMSGDTALIDANTATQRFYTSIQFVNTTLGLATLVRDTLVACTPRTGCLQVFRVVLYKTSDGGTTWTRIAQFFPGNDLSESPSNIYFMDANTGYLIYGADANIYKTVNGGSAWATSYTGSHYPNCIRFLDSNLGYAMGAAGSVLETQDGGNSWQVMMAGLTNSGLNAMAFVGSTGYIVGNGGLIIKKTGLPVPVLELQTLKRGRMDLRYTGSPWYGFVLPDNRVFNILGRQPAKSLPLPLNTR